MPLKKYFQKRDFSITREPHGREHKAARRRFLIHEHHATRLHFDLRLEAEGVLKSWAVPKGPSLNPGEKHLAVMVEDHPIEYGKFEGAIPEGQYGAGEVRIWDKGTYEEIGEPLVRQIAKGKMTFILHGKKLKGEFHMVRIRSKAQSSYSGDNNWLIFKHEDEYADPKWTMKTILKYGSRSEAPGRATKKTAGKDALKKLVSASRKKSTSTTRKKATSKPRATTRLKASTKTKSARTKTTKKKS